MTTRTITKRLDDLDRATGGGEVFGIWWEDSPDLVRIMMPPALAGELTPDEWDQIPEPKTLIRVVRRGPNDNDNEE